MADFKALERRFGTPSAPTAPPGDFGLESIGRHAVGVGQRFLSYDPAFDQSGVPSHSFRAKFGLLDTDEERADWLSKTAGAGGWTQDKYGNYALTPEGMRAVGVPPSDRPTLIDEPLPSRYDIADVAGDIPAIAGGVGGAMAASGLGVLPGAVIAGVGAAVGKGFVELAEHFTGMNKQTAAEVAGDVAMEGLLGAGGELGARTAMTVGRKLMAPYAKRMTPEVRKLAQEAADIGARPKAVQLTKPPLVGRFSAIADRIFGNPLAEANKQALEAEMARLGRYGPRRGAADVGESIVDDIGKARRALSKWAKGIASQIDEAAQGQPFVPTSGLKARAAEIAESLPQAADRTRTVLTPPELPASLRDVQELADIVPLAEMQNITSHLWDAVDDNTIIPGISSRNARQLWKAATQSYEDIADDALRELVLPFRRQYAQAIKKFDNSLVRRIMLDPKYAGQIPPERIVASVFRKGQQQQIRQLRQVVSPERWREVQGAAMEDVLSNVTARTADPLMDVFTGKNLLNALDGYGRGALKEMFGKPVANDLYRLGRVTQLVTFTQAQAGGLVAASLALHPWKNLGRLAQLRLLSKLFNSPAGVRWMTEGLKAPKTRAGSAALARVTAMAVMLAEDETHSPPPVQQRVP